MRRIGIKKTWGNIIILFLIGLVIGVIIGLRQPVSEPTAELVMVQEMPAPAGGK